MLLQKLKILKKKIPDHDKYVATAKFNQFSFRVFDDRLKQVILPNKFFIADFITKAYF